MRKILLFTLALALTVLCATVVLASSRDGTDSPPQTNTTSEMPVITISPQEASDVAIAPAIQPLNSREASEMLIFSPATTRSEVTPLRSGKISFAFGASSMVTTGGLYGKFGREVNHPRVWLMSTTATV